jgi:hypothetical protein
MRKTQLKTKNPEPSHLNRRPVAPTPVSNHDSVSRALSGHHFGFVSYLRCVQFMASFAPVLTLRYIRCLLFKAGLHGPSHRLARA